MVLMTSLPFPLGRDDVKYTTMPEIVFENVISCLHVFGTVWVEVWGII
jgi:hypothetical protein